MIPGALPRHLAATYVATAIVHARDGRATVRTVAELGRRSPATTHRALEQLSALGLVDGLGPGGSGGALRPTAVAMAVGA